MTKQIHSSSVIDPAATIADNVTIGPFCCIGPDVVIGAGTILKSHVVLAGRTTIGENCTIYPFASVGENPQDLKYHGEKSELHIGNNNVIREYVTIHPGTEHGGMKTIVGDNGLFMVGAHVAHDCRVGNGVIMANNATIAGHVQVGDHVIIGGLSAVHQFIRIGDHAIIGGMSAVENDVIPYGRVKGERATLAGLNLIGLERRGFSKQDLKILQKAFNRIFSGDGTLDHRLQMVADEFRDHETVMMIIDFARQKSQFPLCQPPRK